MQRQTNFVQVAGQQIPVDEWRVEGGPTLVFLHGFGRPPCHYEFLQQLAAEQGFRILAPFLYPNNSLREPPRSFRACVALTRAVLRELERQGRLGDGYTLVGHSTGGSVAQCMGQPPPDARRDPRARPRPTRPLRPVGFPASCGAHRRQSATGTNRPDVARPVGSSEVWRRPDHQPPTAARSLLGLGPGSLPASASGVPTPLRCIGQPRRALRRPVHGAAGGGGRILPRASDLRAWMGLVFEDFEVRELRDVRGHEWPIMQPELAAQKVAAWIVGKSRVPGMARLAQLTA